MALVKAGKTAGLPAAGGGAEESDPRLWLEDPDPARRRRAAHAFGQRADAAAALAARLGREEDASVREAVLTALVRTASPEAAARLVPFLASDDAGLRNGAMESLRQMPAAVVLPEAVPLLGDADPDLRIFAAQLVGALPHPERRSRLAAVVEADPQVNVCLAAVEALVETGDPAVLPSLERLAARFPDDPFVAFSVDAARRRFAGN